MFSLIDTDEISHKCHVFPQRCMKIFEIEIPFMFH